MTFNDVSYVELAPGEKLYRIERRHRQPGAVSLQGFHFRPPGATCFGRFDPQNAVTGYFGDEPKTAIYETLLRRERVSVSLGDFKARILLSTRSKARLKLADLRPWAQHMPVLVSTRYRYCQDLGQACFDAGLDGLVYLSAQHPGHHCFVLFPAGLHKLSRPTRTALVLPAGNRLLKCAAQAIYAAQIPLTP